ncbi:MAG: hypothetical protein PV344_00735, partial [Anaplasma sp.]|nr:hypothetical protein [Anaplasma sp.]
MCTPLASRDELLDLAVHGGPPYRVSCPGLAAPDALKVFVDELNHVFPMTLRYDDAAVLYQYPAYRDIAALLSVATQRNGNLSNLRWSPAFTL